MANIVIASGNPLCQSAKNWFIDHGYQENQLDQLKTGDNLIIVAHDSELGDGIGFVNSLAATYNFPMEADFVIKLIVCSAASTMFGKDLVTPAERIANYFQRDVLASDTLVYGEWNQNYANFTGSYRVIPPNADVTSLLEKINLNG